MHRPAPGSTARQRGLTLVEVIVVITLLAGLLAISVPALRAATGANLKQAATELATTLRYTHQESILTNMPMRLAYDLDNNTWWVEAADGPALLFRNRDERVAFADFLERKTESDERVRQEAESRRATAPDQQQIMQQVFGDLGGDEGMPGGMGGLLGGLLGGGAMGPVNRGGEFQPNEFHPIGEQGRLDDDAFRPRELPSGVRFLGVWTPQYEEMVTPLDEFERDAMLEEEAEDQRWTVVYTHTFPGGYLEDGVVYLTDDDGSTVISLTVEPLLGRVELVYDQVEPPDMRDREQR